MLAAYRDQENRTRNCHVPNKQAPKTPSALNPKTPARFRHDENAQTIRGKALGGAAPVQDKMMNTGVKVALRTPGAAPRTVLGNKTTNAKTGFTGVAKQHGKDLEKTQARTTTVQQQRQRAAQAVPIAFNVMEDPYEEEDQEPEYAPPPVTPMPYESDVLPRDLSMEGLKPQNLLRGYHNHYHNPVDSEGRSRSDRKLDAEMDKMLQKAMYDNEQDLQDLEATVCRSRKTPSVDVRAPSIAFNTHTKTSRTEPAILRSKQAATVMSRTTAPKALPKKKAEASQPATRRPLSSLSQTKSSANRSRAAQPVPKAAATGQGLAPRTTLGYNMGRTFSPPVRSNIKAPAARPASTIQPSTHRQPQFLAMFDIEDEGEESLMQLRPLVVADDDASDDEEFELKLDL